MENSKKKEMKETFIKSSVSMKYVNSVDDEGQTELLFRHYCDKVEYPHLFNEPDRLFIFDLLCLKKMIMHNFGSVDWAYYGESGDIIKIAPFLYSLLNTPIIINDRWVIFGKVSYRAGSSIKLAVEDEGGGYAALVDLLIKSDFSDYFYDNSDCVYMIADIIYGMFDLQRLYDDRN